VSWSGTLATRRPCCLEAFAVAAIDAGSDLPDLPGWGSLLLIEANSAGSMGDSLMLAPSFFKRAGLARGLAIVVSSSIAIVL